MEMTENIQRAVTQKRFYNGSTFSLRTEPEQQREVTVNKEQMSIQQVTFEAMKQPDL